MFFTSYIVIVATSTDSLINTNAIKTLHFIIKLKVIDKPLDDRIASTIRHNRARGTHSIDGMQEIMQILIKSGKSDKWISKHLGMGVDEVFRLKQLSGIAELFKDKEFSKSWEVDDD